MVEAVVSGAVRTGQVQTSANLHRTTVSSYGSSATLGFAPATRAGSKEMMKMMWSGAGVGWGGWIMMTAGMVGVSVLLVMMFAALIRSDHQDSPGGPRGQRYDDPMRLLDERFARGEINLEDYQVRRGLLGEARSKTDAT